MKKRIFRIIVYAAVLIAIFKGLDFIMVDDYTDMWARCLWHSYKEHDGEIENLYLGSSHVYCGMDVQLMDQLTGENNFNLASEHQMMNGSYYLLKEACKSNDIKHVYLDVYYDIVCKETYNDDLDPMEDSENYQYNWKNTDYMSPSLNRLQYQLAIGDVEHLINVFVPFTRYRGQIGDFDYYKTTIEAKTSSDYINYVSSNSQETICDKGFRDTNYIFKDNEKIIESGCYLTEENPIGEEEIEYLQKIIDYCKDNDIELTLYSVPVNPLAIISGGNYDLFNEQMNEIAKENGLTFYDFNLIKEDYLDLKDSDFWNVGHLNTTGADKFTEFFYTNIVKKQISDDMFYASYKDKEAVQGFQVYGVYYDDNGDENRTYHIAAVNDENIDYNLSSNKFNGEAYVILYYDQDIKDFTINAAEHGQMTLNAKKKGDPDEAEPIFRLVIEY